MTAGFPWPWRRGAKPAPSPHAHSPIGVRNKADFARGNNEFALDLFARLQSEPGNLWFSPFSLRTALGMTLAGARGETAEQMGAVLRFGGTNDGVHEQIASATRPLQQNFLLNRVPGSEPWFE